MLGLVEAQVGLLQEGFQRLVGTLVDPGAETQGRRALGIGHGGAALAQLVELAGQLRGGLRAEQGKLLAAQAADQGLAEDFLQQAGKTDQGSIAAGVTEIVVDPFEQVEVEHRHAQRALAAAGGLQQVVALLVEGAAVVQVGQAVDLRGALQGIEQLAALQGRHHPAGQLFRAERLA